MATIRFKLMIKNVQEGTVQIIDMRKVDRPHPFPLCANCVPFELVVSAARLGRKYNGGRGSNGS
jgi:hypothetical protein